MVKVIDASALAAICFGEPEAIAVARDLDGTRLIAPGLLDFELTNVAWKIIRREPGFRDLIIAGLRKRADFRIELQQVDWLQTLNLALQTGLSGYDASYLWLSRTRQAPLITLDSKLQRVAIGA